MLITLGKIKKFIKWLDKTFWDTNRPDYYHDSGKFESDLYRRLELPMQTEGERESEEMYKSQYEQAKRDMEADKHHLPNGIDDW